MPSATSQLRHLTLTAALSVVSVLAAAAQTPAPATLRILGDVGAPLTLSAADIKALPRKSVTVTGDDGRTTRYDGVLVGEVLKKAGVPLGHDLTGSAVATYVLASAEDGYQAVFSLAELDPEFTGSEIIIADAIDGKPLFQYQGPFRLVAPHDTRGARGVRMLQSLTVVRVRK